MLRRDVAVGARSIAGQVGVAAVEETVEAQHAELMSFASLPRHLMKQRDSLLSLQNVESLTDELAQLSQDLERLATSEGPADSDSAVRAALILWYRQGPVVSPLLGASSVALVRFSKAQQAFLLCGRMAEVPQRHT